MPKNYILRNLDEALWCRLKATAIAKGLSLRQVIIAALEATSARVRVEPWVTLTVIEVILNETRMDADERARAFSLLRASACAQPSREQP